MKFKFYNPEKLVPIFKERGIHQHFDRVCMGCVYSEIHPADSIHPKYCFDTPSIQSEMLCKHCFVTLEDYKERFHFHTDKDLSIKIAELEEIISMLN